MYGEIRFCASLTSSNVGMYIMLTFCCRFSIIFLCRRNSGTERYRESNQRTPFLQLRFQTKLSHPSDSPNVRCEKLSLQLCRAMIHCANIAGFTKYIRYFGRPRDKNRFLFRQGNSPKVCYYIVWKHTLLLRNFWRYFHCTKTSFRLR